jgi:membrane protein DedA with SNARE-associated domain/rhodanese-related sulfurtransferase
MQLVMSLIEQYGLWLVFATVLIEQLGVPIPAYPVLIVTGAVSARGDYTALAVIVVAVFACVIADLVWYYAGGRFGRRVLRLMCRISLSPDSCVRQTENIYEKFGAPSLMVAKFVPGFAAVATAMAGIIRTRVGSFVLFDAIGALLWVSVGVLIGWQFRDAINDVLDVLDQAGRVGLAVIVLAIALYAVIKAWRRYAFYRQLRMARVTVDELKQMLEEGERPLVVDVRSSSGRESGAIPGSVWIDMKAIDEGVTRLPMADEVIVYCACPNEASAAVVARRLIQQGFKRVRPLAGGIDAWMAAGYEVGMAEERAAIEGLVEQSPRGA